MARADAGRGCSFQTTSRIWDVPWCTQRTLPAMRSLLELPFERVLTSHGPPLHDRAAFAPPLEMSPSSNAIQAQLQARGLGSVGAA